MKKTNLVKSLFAVIAVAIAFTACSQKKQYVDLGELKTLEDSAAYVLGIYEGLGMKGQGIELNPEIFAKAYQQGYAGDTAGCFTREQADEIMRKFQDKMIEKQQSMAKQNAIPYRQAAEKFLESNKSAEGVQTTESGLQYKVIKEGKGVKPTSPDDRVRIHYKLTVLDKDGKYVYGVSTAEDCGGSIKGNRLDLYMDTDPECFQFGVRDCTVYFLGDASWNGK